MALIQCPDCKQRISATASACPQCGWKKQKAGAYKWTSGRIIVLSILLAATAAVVVIWYKDEADSSRRQHDREISALEDELNAVINTP